MKSISTTIFSCTAPFISEKDEQMERDELTEEEQRQIQSDVYGTNGEEYDECDLLSPETIKSSLERLKILLEQPSCKSNQSYMQALQLAPDLIKQESSLHAFLRNSKNFQVDAANKVFKYWELRKRIFGGSLAFAPMTVDGAMANDVDNLNSGVFLILPNDKYGRPVLYFNVVGLETLGPDRDCAPRCLFYLLQMIADNEISCRKGFVVLINTKGYDLAKHYSRPLLRTLVSLFQAFPIQWKATHLLTGAGKGAIHFVLPTMKHILGRNNRLRLIVHSGYDSRLLQSLEIYGLTRKHICSDISGGLYTKFHFILWLERHRRTVVRTQETEGEGKRHQRARSCEYIEQLTQKKKNASRAIRASKMSDLLATKGYFAQSTPRMPFNPAFQS